MASMVEQINLSDPCLSNWGSMPCSTAKLLANPIESNINRLNEVISAHKGRIATLQRDINSVRSSLYKPLVSYLGGIVTVIAAASVSTIFSKVLFQKIAIVLVAVGLIGFQVARCVSIYLKNKAQAKGSQDKISRKQTSIDHLIKQIQNNQQRLGLLNKFTQQDDQIEVAKRAGIIAILKEFGKAKGNNWVIGSSDFIFSDTEGRTYRIIKYNPTEENIWTRFGLFIQNKRDEERKYFVILPHTTDIYAVISWKIDTYVNKKLKSSEVLEIGPNALSNKIKSELPFTHYS